MIVLGRDSLDPMQIERWSLPHEYGHALQREYLPPEIAMEEVTPPYELQATCLAGVFFAAQELAGQRDTVWDIQFPASETHGSTEQQRAALKRGYDAAKANASATCSAHREEARAWAFEQACPRDTFTSEPEPARDSTGLTSAYWQTDL